MPGRVWEKAVEVAMDQHGFITFLDLRKLGADPALLRQWYQRGKVERAGHGIYRFQQIPRTPADPCRLATLWAAGRGVLSHETALDLHELCDVNPTRIHLTVPPSYRPRRKGGERYVVHFERLSEDDVTWYDGIRIVVPAIAIRQALDTGVPTYLTRQAIERAIRLGLVSRPLLEQMEKRLALKS